MKRKAVPYIQQKKQKRIQLFITPRKIIFLIVGILLFVPIVIFIILPTIDEKIRYFNQKAYVIEDARQLKTIVKYLATLDYTSKQTWETHIYKDTYAKDLNVSLSLPPTFALDGVRVKFKDPRETIFFYLSTTGKQISAKDQIHYLGYFRDYLGIRLQKNDSLIKDTVINGKHVLYFLSEWIYMNAGSDKKENEYTYTILMEHDKDDYYKLFELTTTYFHKDQLKVVLPFVEQVISTIKFN